MDIVNAFSNDLAEKFKPYVGIKRLDAVAVLKEQPLEITDEQAQQVFKFSQQEAVNRLTDQWQQTSTAISFDQLSVPCQTVIASVAFQYGNLAKRTPNFWQQVVSEDWHSAIENLRNFGDKYPTRRNKEADYLQRWLDTQ